MIVNNEDRKVFEMKIPVWILLSSILFFAESQSRPLDRDAYQIPEQINDGLTVGSLEEVHLDPVVIEKAVQDIRQGQYEGVHSILIYKDDKLVFEEYFPMQCRCA